MKQIYFAIAWLIACNIAWGQSKKKIDFSNFDTRGLKTKIFVTDVKPFSVLGQKSTSFNMYNLHESYQELSKADLQKRFKNQNLIKSEIKFTNQEDILKIGLIHTEFEIPSKEAFKKGQITFTNNVAKRSSTNYVFDKLTKTIIAPLAVRKKGVTTKFIFDSKMVVNTTQNKIKSILVNFDDGKGFVNTEIDKYIEVNYLTEGDKKIQYKLTLDNNETITTQSVLNVTYSNTDLARLFRRTVNLVTATRQPDLAIYGETDMSVGKCEYEIFNSPDGIFDKPVYIIDGFDPTDGRNTSAIYNLLTYTDASNVTRNLGDRIRNEEGYDVVIINFPEYTNSAGNLIDGGADYVERNAMNVITVMETLNAQKVGTEKNVIIGPSMGGLISRYALRYMEQNNIDHQTRLWLSFDSPHYGANVPIGLQHLFNYFAYGYGDSDGVKPLIDGMLRSPAAKQMLVDHFQAHINKTAGQALGADPIVPSTGLPLTPTGYPGFRDNFQNRMNALGFPQTTRNISMINGSGTLAKFKDKNGGDINPGFDFIGTSSSQANIDTGDVFLLINTRAMTFCEFMPTANTQETIVDVDIQAQIFFWVTQDSFLATAKQNSTSHGVDSSPGGLYDMAGLAASLPPGDDVLINFLNAMKADKFSFIPATSAMGLNTGGNINSPQPNYYHSFNLGTKDTPWDGVNTNTTNTTPFKNWHLPSANENHVTVTQGNVDFAWCEIIKPTYTLATSSATNISSCTNTTVTIPINISNLRGCNSVILSASGVPTGASATFSSSTIIANGNYNLNLSGLPVGTHTISINANNNVSPTTIPVTITIYPSNPNLAGTTQYKVNAGNFTTATSVTVMPGTNLELQIPSNLYVGTINWYNPQGNLVATNTNASITNIQDGSSEEGNWKAVVTFTNDCAKMAPSDIFFNVMVDPSLATHNNEFIGLKVYPNPTNGILKIEAATSLNEAKTKIIDLRGRTILENTGNFINTNSIELNLSLLTKGSYFLIIEDSKNKTIKQIIKQ